MVGVVFPRAATLLTLYLDFWIIGMSIIGSVLIYAPGTTGNGSIAYIDALFFASGANTQAGPARHSVEQSCLVRSSLWRRSSLQILTDAPGCSVLATDAGAVSH